MPQPTVAAEIHQSLERQLNLTPKVTFDLISVLDDLSDVHDVLVGQRVNASGPVDLRLLKDLHRSDAADAVDIGQRNVDPLGTRKVNTGYTCHFLTPAAACAADFGKSLARHLPGESLCTSHTSSSRKL